MGVFLTGIVVMQTYAELLQVEMSVANWTVIGSIHYLEHGLYEVQQM